MHFDGGETAARRASAAVSVDGKDDARSIDDVARSRERLERCSFGRGRRLQNVLLDGPGYILGRLRRGSVRRPCEARVVDRANDRIERRCRPRNDDHRDIDGVPSRPIRCLAGSYSHGIRTELPHRCADSGAQLACARARLIIDDQNDRRLRRRGGVPSDIEGPPRRTRLAEILSAAECGHRESGAGEERINPAARGMHGACKRKCRASGFLTRGRNLLRLAACGAQPRCGLPTPLAMRPRAARSPFPRTPARLSQVP